MNYSPEPKYIKCRINSKNITDEEMIKDCFFENEEKVAREFYKKIDGAILILSLWDYDKHKYYHLSDWTNSMDEQVMKAIFEIEKVFGTYGNYEEFKEIWNTGEYDPCCTITFPKCIVEELGVIK